MTGPGTPACYLAPSERESRHRLYRALAQELSASTEPGVVLVEVSVPAPTAPKITVRPADLGSSALAGQERGPLRGDDVGASQDPPDGARGVSVTWMLRPRPGSPAATSLPGAWVVPDPAAVLGPTGRLDVQTFWMGGRSDGRIWAGRRVRFQTSGTPDLDLRSGSVARLVAGEWSRASGVLSIAAPHRESRSAWVSGATRSWPKDAWIAVPPLIADRLAEPILLEPSRPPVTEGHAVALGASGAGKTTYLADAASRAVREGAPVLALDLHGDLAPAIVDRLDADGRARLVAVDAGRRPVVGIAALAGQGDREAAQLVAAVKRLSPDGADVYWGFRLERIFDACVRLVQETGGTLADLYALLTDADRRDAARLATGSPELARFLDELGPIVRRNPDFLWSAAARLAKVVLVPELAELLAPADDGVPVEDLLDGGRSVLVRLPFAALGPEAATLAGSLVLARCYLGLVARRASGRATSPIVVVLDEVHGFSPRLVAEMLTEGRKFGLRLVVASQYPERLASELRHAAAGVARTVVAFRAPRASSEEVGGWLGLGPIDAQRILPELPVGLGVTRAAGSGELIVVASERGAGGDAETGWTAAVERTRSEFPPVSGGEPATADAATERLLLAILAATEQGRPLVSDELVDAALSLPGPCPDRAVLEDRAGRLGPSGLAGEVAGRWELTPAGERRLGLLATTGASRESAEHRALLLRGFRLFARRGLRLEIVRQGRYDTTLPDAVFRQLPEAARRGSPRDLAIALAAVEPGWAWRFFDGRDVHVEAEVSGALRPARVRHGLAKARARQAFALFLVGDSARASKVRRTLRAEGSTIREAQVWTLRFGDRAGPRR